jgi:ElaA protein
VAHRAPGAVPSSLIGRWLNRGMPSLHDCTFSELEPATLYGILRLRAEVFVVEQECAYLDVDGRDLEPATRQLWFEADDGAVVATARVLDDGDARRVGRIATHSDHRGQRLAARLVEHFLASSTGPWRLDAQSYLADWYARFGFVVDGPEYLEDGIPHVPMLRDLR